MKINALLYNLAAVPVKNMGFSSVYLSMLIICHTPCPSVSLSLEQFTGLAKQRFINA